MAIFDTQHGPVEEVTTDNGVIWVPSDDEEAEEVDEEVVDADQEAFI